MKLKSWESNCVVRGRVLRPISGKLQEPDRTLSSLPGLGSWNRNWATRFLWLELLAESAIIPQERLAELMKETDELTRITV
jgi:hypothetical protein